MSESYTGADCFVDALEQYGVSYVFGNPGTTELPVLKSLAASDIEYILGLHEDIAVGMAGGYASTRRYHAHSDPDVCPVGVANLHLAPGLAHGLGNLYAAKVAGAPVVVTAGNHSTDFRHEEPILSGDLVSLAEEFTKWSAEVLDVAALPAMIRRAFRTALTPPTGPVFLGLPLDTMLAETDAEPERLGEIPTAGGGDPTQLARAAELLTAAEAPTMIVGDQIARAGSDAVDAAVTLAETAGLRVHGEILSCEVNFPTTHDQWVSYIPPDEGLAARVMGADTLVFAGCSTNTTLTRHENPLIDSETTCIHLGPDAWELGKHQPADAAVLGDPGEVMRALAERIDLEAGVRKERLDRVEETKAGLADTLDSIGRGTEDDPRASKAELAEALIESAPDAYIVDEGVTAKYALLTRWPLAAEGMISNKGGGLGYGLPASVGAAIAESEHEGSRTVLGFVGDGSYLYYPHTLYSAARHDVDLTVVIADNRNYRILKDNTIGLFGGEDADHDYVGMDFEPPVDLVTNAQSHGADAELVETPEGIAPAVGRAVESEGPTVLDVLVRD
ncbi:thiamine pyrophosphate-binding protein [Halalkalicoccus jeotgali]|uniref:Thiamine pyrophosphate protein TPP binding domain protein n=1 Tax=Halalkalicoccus jeotgali (strain DSM 18796 / CECT 7217 / JCM 14584 / KCTC 4019 / B3) TaxID=795797 RepID=D8J6E5_HALJB|nr:thiamine pyrophosphate-binding protein [Halalkalicoccus jeotgali]ADJ15863.1 thiamine pyrophosphate protein TPP binding domain protein [Halalkalicoccus jeotgali B3]ELY37959.1 thiamine pyrophosphate protein TPP binding domain-containing protein [Halalkalicoccus jeotgali B3]